MALLVFSNTGKFGDTDITFCDVISTESITNKGIIKSVQDYIKDDNVLDDYYVDEHLGLEVKCPLDTMELVDTLNCGNYTIWSNFKNNPDYYVICHTANFGTCIYLFYNITRI